MPKKLSLLILLLWTSSLSGQIIETTQVTVTGSMTDKKFKAAVEKNLSDLLTTFNHAALEGSRPQFRDIAISQQAKATVLSMWKSSSMMCPEKTVSGQCVDIPSGGYQIRNVPITFLGKHDKGSEDQNMVFNLDGSGTVDNIYIALDEDLYRRAAQAVDIDDMGRRMVILDFVENFRTAYNRKDLETMNKIFSEDALILTGKVIIKKNETDGLIGSLPHEEIVMQRQNKSQYLADLKQTFAKNKYISVGFDDLRVIRHPKHKHIYGVTLKQRWNSSTADHTGYLFLIVKFIDLSLTEAEIMVRTWQPDTLNGQPLPRSKVYSLNNFNFN